MQKHTRFLLPAAFLLTGSLICACNSIGSKLKPSQAEASTPDAVRKISVAVVPVRRTNISQPLKLAAEFRPMQEVELHAKVAGYVKEIKVDVGDFVRQGQLIATLEVPEFKSDLSQAEATKRRSVKDVQRASSEVQKALSTYNAARLTYDRLASVGKARPDLLAQQEIDDAQARVQIADAQLSTAKAAQTVAEEQVKVVEASESRVKTIAEYSTILAPFAGLITKRYADKGAMIQAGISSQSQAMPVVRLSDVSTLRLIIAVPESAVPTIKTGRQVTVSVASLNQDFEGRVTRYVGKIDPATHTMETEVDVRNPGNRLKPGMFATALLNLVDRQNILAVPLSTVIKRENKTLVYVVDSSGKVSTREIQTGIEGPELVEILNGLQEGELVIASNTSLLKPGQEVEARTAGAEKGGR